MCYLSEIIKFNWVSCILARHHTTFTTFIHEAWTGLISLPNYKDGHLS